MARHGENIRKRKDGRWEGRCLYYNEEKGKNAYRSIYGHSYEEVREKKDSQGKAGLQRCSEYGFGDRDEEAGHASAQILFTDLAAEWLASIRDSRKPSTYIKYGYIYRKHIEPAVNGVSLAGMSDQLIRERISDPLSDSLKKSIRCVINQILKTAPERYPLTFPKLGKDSCPVRKKPIEKLPMSEQARLLSALHREPDVYKTAALLSLYTGLRLGEVCALKWEDIDFGRDTLMVKRTVQRLPVEGQGAKTALVETSPKSDYSRREIPLPAQVAGLLEKYRNGKEYVFRGDRPLDPRTVQYHFKKIMSEAGISDSHFHILRHTFATNCIEKGMDIKSLSEILGHSDVEITLNRYVHPSMETKRSHMDGLFLFYGQIQGQVS